jgi:protein involved in polysaccharide export with SLBB domain
VLNALHAAGGPTERGSFRRIEVRRGAQLVGTFDMYDYLLAGDASNDIRLEHGDRVFVPPAGPQARVEGFVRRPAIYEIRPGEEGLADLLAFAGGLQADAVVSRVQIDRILPPNERTPGRYRAIRDTDLIALFEAGEFIPIRDGDVIHVTAISDQVRDRVWLTGAVNNPGLFEWSSGITLSDLIDRADGLADPAYQPRLQIYRLDPATGNRSMLRAAAPVAGGPDPLLADGDSVVVLSREDLNNPSFVSIDGFVKTPDEYGFAEGMTLRDLVLAADGFIPGANVAAAEVSRLTNPFERSDTTAHIIRVALGADTADVGYLGAGEWPPGTPDIELRPGDRVIIRRAPGYEPLGQVAVTGEVLFPGAYVLGSRQERVVDVLNRAGWLTPEAHEAGIRVIRRGTIVAADIEEALTDPSHRSNIRLEPGDSVHVSAYDPTVNVVGAVTFASRVLYREGRDLGYYLDQAGGALDIAATDRITVTYPNGQRARIRELIWFDRVPEVLPGSTIFVPEKPQSERDGFNLDQFFTRTLTIVSTVVTILVAASRL